MGGDQFKCLSIFNSHSCLIHWSKTVSTTVVESHLGNMHVEFDLNWLNDIGEAVVYRFFFSAFSSGSHPVHWSKTILTILVVSHLSNIPVKFDINWLNSVGGVII